MYTLSKQSKVPTEPVMVLQMDALYCVNEISCVHENKLETFEEHKHNTYFLKCCRDGPLCEEAICISDKATDERVSP